MILYPPPRPDRWDPWLVGAVFTVMLGSAALILLR
jgi:hypothetical protein